MHDYREQRMDLKKKKIVDSKVCLILSFIIAIAIINFIT